MQTKTTLLTSISVAMFLAAAGSLFGATVVGVDFENGSGGFSIAPDDLDLTDGITVSTITTGSGGAPAGFANDNGANGDVAFEGSFVARFESSTTPSFFDITIDNSETFNFESVSFAYRGATGGNSSREIILTASIGGGSAITLYDVDNSGNTLSGRTATPDWAGARNPTVTLGSSFQNLTNTTIRFNWSTAGGGIDVDAIQINASVVPEPSSFALLAGCFGLTWVMLRRRA